MCLSNFRALEKLYIWTSWLRDFMRSYRKTSVRLMDRGPELWPRLNQRKRISDYQKPKNLGQIHVQLYDQFRAIDRATLPCAWAAFPTIMMKDVIPITVAISGISEYDRLTLYRCSYRLPRWLWVKKKITNILQIWHLEISNLFIGMLLLRTGCENDMTEYHHNNFVPSEFQSLYQKFLLVKDFQTL